MWLRCWVQPRGLAQAVLGVRAQVQAQWALLQQVLVLRLQLQQVRAQQMREPLARRVLFQPLWQERARVAESALHAWLKYQLTGPARKRGAGRRRVGWPMVLVEGRLWQAEQQQKV